MEIKIKTAKNGVTSTVTMELHKDLILKRPNRQVVLSGERKKTTYGEAL